MSSYFNECYKVLLMKQKKLFNVIGVMTGTSMDGIDISYVSTDGIKKSEFTMKKAINIQ